MRAGSLFSGIGGLDLGLERAGMRVVWQCESDPYCRRVLARHWPEVTCYEDIRTVEWESVESVDLVCGGFPCQPVSVAGKQLAQEDERWLWPEFVRCIRSLRPLYVLVENVPGLLVRGMGDVLGDLAERGYDAEWDCIPAGAFGAHFVGDRVFVVASRSATSCLRREGCWKAEVGADQWGRDELEGLVRLEVESGVPAGSLGRVSDGVPFGLERRRALGNAVVPQVGEWIGRRILEAQ
jgi:DNA (cytosine-5)-methyltransferase 1